MDRRSFLATPLAALVPGSLGSQGAPPSPTHALHVLATGFQRQRALAARWRSVLQPGTPLFNIAAPVPRQRG